MELLLDNNNEFNENEDNYISIYLENNIDNISYASYVFSFRNANNFINYKTKGKFIYILVIFKIF